MVRWIGMLGAAVGVVFAFAGACAEGSGDPAAGGGGGDGGSGAKATSSASGAGGGSGGSSSTGGSGGGSSSSSSSSSSASSSSSSGVPCDATCGACACPSAPCAMCCAGKGKVDVCTNGICGCF